MNNEIAAHINGADIKLHIRRDNLPIFEAVIGGSAFAVLKRFERGEWSTRDVVDVLGFSHRGPSQFERMFAKMGHPAAEPRPPDALIAAAVAKNGPGTYADLAALVLSAALFNVADSDRAWTDEAADAG